jgi:hypothetical protein
LAKAKVIGMKFIMNRAFFILLALVGSACTRAESSKFHTVIGKISATNFKANVDGMRDEGGEYVIDRVETVSNGYRLEYLYGVRACKDQGNYVDVSKFNRNTLFQIKFYAPDFGLVFDFEENGKRVVGVARRLIECEKIQ